MGGSQSNNGRSSRSKRKAEREYLGDDENDTIWKHEMTVEEARIRFEDDGTVPVNCSDEMLELRMYISDPSLLRSLVSYAQGTGKGRNTAGKKNVMMIRRWADMMAFKYVSNDTLDLKISTGYDLYFNYMDPQNAGVRRVFCEPKIVEKIEKELRQAASGHHKTASDSDEILPSSLFDEIYFADMETILNRVFIPFKSSPAYQTALSNFKTQYNKTKVTDFEYYEALGHGGFGCVVHCKKKSTGVHYAMKIQTKDGVVKHCHGDFRMATLEKEALVLCNHPFITNLIYAFQNEQLVMMVMNLAGGSLADFAEEVEGGVLSEEHVLFYAAEVLLALNHIHRLGMIYRDMKPSNILLMEDGHVKLADLGGVADVGSAVSGYHTQAHDGLFAAAHRKGVTGFESEISSSIVNPSQSIAAKMSSSEPSDSSLGDKSMSVKSFTNRDVEGGGNRNRNSASGKAYKMAAAPTAKDVRLAYSYFGTAGFIAPEVVRNMVKPGEEKGTEKRAGYTHAVDFFSLGVTIYNLLTAQFPFEFRTTQMENFDRSFIYRPFPEKPDGGHVASEACRDLLEKLLVGEEKKRLGYGRSGCSNIKKHPVFAGMSWIMLAQRKVVPPEIPERLINNMREGGHLSRSQGAAEKFDGFYQMLMAMGHTVWVTHTHIKPEEQVHFRGWDYVSPDALSLEIMHANDHLSKPTRSPDPKSNSSWFGALPSFLGGTNAAQVAPDSHARSLNEDLEASSYMASVHMVDTAASVLRTIEAAQLEMGGVDEDEDKPFETAL